MRLDIHRQAVDIRLGEGSALSKQVGAGRPTQLLVGEPRAEGKDSADDDVSASTRDAAVDRRPAGSPDDPARAHPRAPGAARREACTQPPDARRERGRDPARALRVRARRLPYAAAVRRRTPPAPELAVHRGAVARGCRQDCGRGRRLLRRRVDRRRASRGMRRRGARLSRTDEQDGLAADAANGKRRKTPTGYAGNGVRGKAVRMTEPPAVRDVGGSSGRQVPWRGRSPRPARPRSGAGEDMAPPARDPLR